MEGDTKPTARCRSDVLAERVGVHRLQHGQKLAELGIDADPHAFLNRAESGDALPSTALHDLADTSAFSAGGLPGAPPSVQPEAGSASDSGQPTSEGLHP
jgi:hypothetical protein